MGSLDDSKICPLCGEDNHCQSGEETCWCFSIEVPKKLLEKIPEEKRGKACICEKCIREFNSLKEK